MEKRKSLWLFVMVFLYILRFLSIASHLLSCYMELFHMILSIKNLFQVMYAFVMRPESLPKAYQDFIQKTGPVAKPVYKAVRDSCRGYPVDVASLHAYLSRVGKSDYVKLEEFPSIIPCSIIHPGTNSCLAHQGKATSATFKKTFPLYFSLTFVPFVVLHLQKVISHQTIFVTCISANQMFA